MTARASSDSPSDSLSGTSCLSPRPAPVDPAALVPGAWVLLESLLVTRHVSRAWQVVRVSGKRVYLRSFVRDPVTHALEVREERHASIDTVRAVFPNEATAQALVERDAAASREMERVVNEARAAFERAYASALAELQVHPLPKAPDAPPDPEPVPAPEPLGKTRGAAAKARRQASVGSGP